MLRPSRGFFQSPEQMVRSDLTATLLHGVTLTEQGEMTLRRRSTLDRERIRPGRQTHNPMGDSK